LSKGGAFGKAVAEGLIPWLNYAVNYRLFRGYYIKNVSILVWNVKKSSLH